MGLAPKPDLKKKNSNIKTKIHIYHSHIYKYTRSGTHCYPAHNDYIRKYGIRIWSLNFEIFSKIIQVPVVYDLLVVTAVPVHACFLSLSVSILTVMTKPESTLKLSNQRWLHLAVSVSYIVIPYGQVNGVQLPRYYTIETLQMIVCRLDCFILEILTPLVWKQFRLENKIHVKK